MREHWVKNSYDKSYLLIVSRCQFGWRWQFYSCWHTLAYNINRIVSKGTSEIVWPERKEYIIHSEFVVHSIIFFHFNDILNSRKEKS